MAEEKRQNIGKDESTKRRNARARRHSRLRKKVAGTAARPRMVVNRSTRNIHVQLIDDQAGHCLLYTSPSPRD